MGRLRCDGVDVVMQEVPGEVSLAINVTECPHHCVGCHSAHLAESYGDYVGDILEGVLQKYKGLITCVCFMGGDQHMDDLVRQAAYINSNYPELKLALYTGHDGFPMQLSMFNYIKFGHYDAALGGLDNPNTNQRFYRRRSDGRWEDVTFWFWKGDRLNESAIC